MYQFYFGKTREKNAEVQLTFQAAGGDLVLHVSCLMTADICQISLIHGGVALNHANPQTESLVRRLYKVEPYFIPSLGTIGPSETVLSYPQLMSMIAEGRFSESWRNQLQWLNEGRRPEAFQAVERALRNYLSDVQLRPPHRSRDNPPHVLVHYEEGGVEHDISEAGGGLRTLIALSAGIELSTTPILLLDEPDAHLHSTVQRQVARLFAEKAGPNRQILVSTHAPDFIDEVSTESLLWIEREMTTAEHCDDAGKVLVSLGAFSNSQAMRSLGSDTVLFFEAKPDRQTLTEVMKRCGKDELAIRVKPALLKGFGDASNLPAGLRILKALLPVKVAVAAVLDADYTLLQPKLTVEDLGEAMVFRLPCKELENLLLNSGDTIEKAAKIAAEVRSVYSSSPTISPTSAQVEAKIDELTAMPDLHDLVRPQWLVRWAGVKGIHDAGQLINGEREFEACWSSAEWRRRCCPGKEVLSRLRQWLQAEPYKLSLTLTQLFNAYTPGKDIQELFDKLEDYVKKARA